MEQSGTLYNKYDFSEPWNGPNNIKLLDSMPSNFACPSRFDNPTKLTSYVVITGPGTMFPGGHFGQVRGRHRWTLEHADGCRGRECRNPLDSALGP